MPTLNQLIRHGREEKRRTDRTRASDQCPQKQGVRPRVPTRTPKKPNSAPRKIAKVRLSNRHDIFAHIPGVARRFIPFFLLLLLLSILYIISLNLGAIPFFLGLIKKEAGVAAGRIISFLLIKKMGFSAASAMLLGCAVRALATAEATLPIGKMMLPGETSEASSSGLTLEQAVLNENEDIRNSIINGISRYLDIFEKEIIQEYPEAAVKIGTLTFFETLRKSIVSDYGFESPAPSSLTTLKKCHTAIKEELSFLDDKPPYWKNNIIYDNLRVVILREKGEPPIDDPKLD